MSKIQTSVNELIGFGTKKICASTHQISPVASLDMVLSIKRITKVLISMWGCAGWPAPLLSTNPRTDFLAFRPIFVQQLCFVIILYSILWIFGKEILINLWTGLDRLSGRHGDL